MECRSGRPHQSTFWQADCDQLDTAKIILFIPNFLVKTIISCYDQEEKIQLKIMNRFLYNSLVANTTPSMTEMLANSLVANTTPSMTEMLANKFGTNTASSRFDLSRVASSPLDLSKVASSPLKELVKREANTPPSIEVEP